MGVTGEEQEARNFVERQRVESIKPRDSEVASQVLQHQHEWPQARKTAPSSFPRYLYVIEEKVTVQQDPQQEPTVLLAVTTVKQIAHSHGFG